jgi:hypothetical protein
LTNHSSRYRRSCSKSKKKGWSGDMHFDSVVTKFGWYEWKEKTVLRPSDTARAYIYTTCHICSAKAAEKAYGL